MGFTEKINAQPPGEGWVSLKDAVKNNFIPFNHEGMPYGYNHKIKLYNLEPVNISKQVFIDEIAFKNEKKLKTESNPNLILEGVVGIEKTQFISSDRSSVNGSLELNINNQKVNKKNLKKENNGWMSYKFDNLQRILFIGEFIESPSAFVNKKGDTPSSYYDYPIFSNIYVKLGDGSAYIKEVQDYIAKENEEKKRAKAEAEEREYKEKLAKIFTTPQDKGWTSIKSEQLKDGTVVEHYAEGIRFIKKPNGDYASFKEPYDQRDPKTLDMVKGYDLPLDAKSIPVGDFRLTYANGVVGQANRDAEMYIASNGQTLKMEGELIKTKRSYLLPNGMIGYYPTMDITYELFNNPNNESQEFVYGGIKNHSYFDITTTRQNAFSVFTNDSENEHLLNLYIDKAGKFAIGEPINEKNKCFYLYKFDNNGLVQNEIVIMPGGDINTLPISTKIKEVTTDKIIFENNDYMNYSMGAKFGKPIAVYSDLFLTLNDGTIIEKIEGKYRIKSPDGSRYVGTIFPPYDDNYTLTQLRDGIEAITNGKSPRYWTGYLTTKEGKEIEYKDAKNLTEPEKPQQREETEEEKAFYKKYGRDNVFNARLGIVKVGMPLELIRIFMDPYLDSESTNSAWYKVNVFNGFTTNHWYFRVNKKTGKVEYVSK